jgi:hypothetical protein
VKLVDLKAVTAGVGRLTQLEQGIAAAELGLIAVSLGANLQDDAMSAAVKGAILAELRGRQAQVRRELTALGVDVDAT